MKLTAILLNGLPGSGKGTQVGLIEKEYDVLPLSSGDLLRAEIAARTDIGVRIGKHMARGELIPDAIVTEMFASRIETIKSGMQLLIEGFPRTLDQLSWLRAFLDQRSDFLPAMLYLDVPVSVLVHRLSTRRICSVCGRIYNLQSAPPLESGICDADGAGLIQRNDDKSDLLEKRLTRLKLAETTMLNQASSYVSVHMIDGDRPPDRVYSALVGYLDRWLH